MSVLLESLGLTEGMLVGGEEDGGKVYHRSYWSHTGREEGEME